MLVTLETLFDLKEFRSDLKEFRSELIVSKAESYKCYELALLRVSRL